jgi:hypothetical protein
MLLRPLHHFFARDAASSVTLIEGTQSQVNPFLGHFEAAIARPIECGVKTVGEGGELFEARHGTGAFHPNMLASLRSHPRRDIDGMKQSSRGYLPGISWIPHRKHQAEMRFVMAAAPAVCHPAGSVLEQLDRRAAMVRNGNTS